MQIEKKELMAVINGIGKGKFFNIAFRRAEPKCESCGKKSKKWLVGHPDTCPHCGGRISYERTATAQKGVYRPADESIAPKGIGETFAERRENGIFGFYDSVLKQYRECRIGNILRISCNGNEYEVKQQ